MASKKQLVPSEILTIQSLPPVDSGFVGFGAKEDGLYMKFSDGSEFKLLSLKDGNVILSGTTTPSNSLGRAGDYYINNTDWTIYGPKTIVWGSPTNLRGEDAQSTFTKGDNLIVDNLYDLYNLYTRVNDLIENLSRVFVLSEQKSYLLININDFSDNAFNPSAWKLIEEGIYDAPIDNEIHGRRNGEWVPLDFAEKNHDHDIGNQILFFENSLI